MKQEQSVLNEVENLEKLAEVYIKDVLNKKDHNFLGCGFFVVSVETPYLVKDTG